MVSTRSSGLWAKVRHLLSICVKSMLRRRRRPSQRRRRKRRPKILQSQLEIWKMKWKVEKKVSRNQIHKNKHLETRIRPSMKFRRS